VGDVDPYPTTFVTIPWSDDYNPYQFEAWTALLDADSQKSWGTQ
jgi:hypothetical protein